MHVTNSLSIPLNNLASCSEEKAVVTTGIYLFTEIISLFELDNLNRGSSLKTAKTLGR